MPSAVEAVAYAERGEGRSARESVRAASFDHLDQSDAAG